MILTKNTRFILDGKIVEDVTHAMIEYWGDSEHLRTSISKDGGVTFIRGVLLGIEMVVEKENFKDESGVTWTQFICETDK
jgi:hypothetical protein